METESNPELKHFYGQKLLQLLPFLGLGTVRWLSTLLPIISTHTQIPHCRQGNLSRGIEIFNLFVTSKKRNHQFTNLQMKSAAKCLLKPLK